MRCSAPASRRLGAVAALLSIATGLVGCGGEAAEPLDVRPSAIWTVDPDPAASIGQVKGPGEYLFGSISSVASTGDGGVVVADRQAVAVRLYDSAGLFIRELGRTGEGPGEFRDVAGVWVTATDTVSVLDLRLRRVARFSMAGELLGTTSLEQVRQMRADHFLGVLSDGSFVVGTGGGFVDTENPGVSAEELNFWRFAADGTYRGGFSGLTGRWWYSPVRRSDAATVPTGLPGGGVHALSPAPRIAVHGDSMFVADQLEPALLVLSNDGAISRRIPLPGGIVEEAEARDRVRLALRAAGDEAGVSRLEGMPRLVRVPQVFGLLVDDHGRIWVSDYDPTRNHSRTPSFRRRLGDGGRWRVLDRTGDVLATMELPDGLMPMEVRASRITGIRVDAYGTEQVEARAQWFARCAFPPVSCVGPFLGTQCPPGSA